VETEAVPEICAAMTSEPHGPTLNLKASVVFRTTKFKEPWLVWLKRSAETMTLLLVPPLLFIAVTKSPPESISSPTQNSARATYRYWAERVHVNGEVPAPNLDNARILDGHPIRVRSNQKVFEAIEVGNCPRQPEWYCDPACLITERTTCPSCPAQIRPPQIAPLARCDVHAAPAPNSQPLVQAAIVGKEAQGRALRIARHESSAEILTESPGRSCSTHLCLRGRSTRHSSVFPITCRGAVEWLCLCPHFLGFKNVDGTKLAVASNFAKNHQRLV